MAEIDYVSHFKDEAIAACLDNHERRAAAMYATWRAMSELQDFPPYSVKPRAWAGKK